ncbi:MAG: peroxiredoxin family protein [Candidatus Methylomirabilales bacterium]
MQFADFGGRQEEFKGAKIGIIALSVDREEDGRKMVERHKIAFPVVYGLDVRKEGEKIGAYFDSENGYFQPANFILRNDRVFHATYSSGPLGRLQAQQVLMLVGHYREQEKAG